MSNWYPFLHRWLGIGSLVFVLVLSGTGMALNHATDWALDKRYVSSEWLLRRYGIDAPMSKRSFAVDRHTVVLIGGRLYFDERELVDGVADLAGAVTTPTHIAIATPFRVLLVDGAGALIEQIRMAGFLPDQITALGRSGSGLAYRSGDRVYYSDADVLDVVPWTRLGERARIEWSKPSALAPQRLEQLQRLYRGSGLSVERLLLDIHSGRFFSRFGSRLMDVVGMALIALSALGLLLWNRRRRRGRSAG